MFSGFSPWSFYAPLIACRWSMCGTVAAVMVTRVEKQSRHTRHETHMIIMRWKCLRSWTMWLIALHCSRNEQQQKVQCALIALHAELIIHLTIIFLFCRFCASLFNMWNESIGRPETRLCNERELSMILSGQNNFSFLLCCAVKRNIQFCTFLFREHQRRRISDTLSHNKKRIAEIAAAISEMYRKSLRLSSEECKTVRPRNSNELIFKPESMSSFAMPINLQFLFTFHKQANIYRYLLLCCSGDEVDSEHMLRQASSSSEM